MVEQIRHQHAPGFARRARVAIGVDEAMALDAIYRAQDLGNNLGALTLSVITLVVLLLSAAGMYSLMAFTVSQRRREIGIRSALGVQPYRLLLGVFKRAAGQVAIGALAGVAVALLLDHYLPIEEIGGWNVPGVIPATVGFMLLVAIVAAAGPARRALRVEPIAELREG